MPTHTIRIESNSDWCIIELRSAATWARAPGRMLHCSTIGASLDAASLEIDDRRVALRQTAGASAHLTLVVQIATQENRAALHTRKSANGVVKLVSMADARSNDRSDDDENPLDLTLVLESSAAASLGAVGGDSSLGPNAPPR